MAKQANELDLSLVKRKLSNLTAKQNWEKIFGSLNQTHKQYLETLSSNRSVNCHIFSGSIAFRIGKSSIKSLQDYPTGLKGGIPQGKTANEIFLNTNYLPTLSVTKDKFIVVAAHYFLLNYFERVKTESDKTEAAETEQIIRTQEKLKEVIKDYGEVKLKIGDNFYQVDKFEQVAGRPKADAVFSYKGKPTVFLSLKKGARPANFQQYGGSIDLDVRNEDYSHYPDIEKFRKRIVSIFEAFDLKKSIGGKYDFSVFKKGAYFGQLVEDNITSSKVMFGKDFATKHNGEKIFGLNNCNATIDGDIFFNKVNKTLNVYELSGKFHISINPYEYKVHKYPDLDPNDVYTPVLFIQISAAQGLNQLGFLNARFNIWPKNIPASKGIVNIGEIEKAIKTNDNAKLTELKKRYLQ